jgi:hypothetical protein
VVSFDFCLNLNRRTFQRNSKQNFQKKKKKKEEIKTKRTLGNPFGPIKKRAPGPGSLLAEPVPSPYPSPH